MPAPRLPSALTAQAHTRAWLSPAEVVALAGAAALIALQAITPLHEPLTYRYDSALAQPWRLLSAHIVHLNWPHVLINAAAWWVVARLFAPELGVRRQLVVVLAAALAIGLVLRLALPEIAGYRGFSGVLHAVFFAGATHWWIAALADRPRRSWAALWLPTALFAGGWIKVLLEQPWDATTPYAEWLGAGVVPQAHGVGAVVGTVLGAGWYRRSQQRG
jgi:rhomboid family GlyGly-CTERM serine protease